ncbi:uncharacterized protein PITG_00920 [Phytophthora infestans T30-4]|uniref:Glycoside-Pentoside-Hexuronide (GPH):Cation Symporter Family n=1 Tax=Phytophthora infestans (strain T30-4) TaxID=403677 RepID=D0MS07_PHYIT|nr:uncharacterized protein PITG_00920 [Phytophthora infestans T30-4]EEY58276.1 conserved hypothetical protein [Phytophthora infestans T30-4]|eukprot:XP_002909462.1 conserved hypothetical protein [Phytophthora infestans T30-4]
MGYTRQIGDALGDIGDGKKGQETHRFWTIFFTVFFYTWMDITVNVVQTPLYLMISDFAGERQTLASSLALGWSCLGSILVSGYIYLFGAAHLTLRWFLFMLSITMSAFEAIDDGFKSLPVELLKYCAVIFCVSYGNTAYNGNKGQFFGIEVYGGSAMGAKTCAPDCTQAQDAYNRGRFGAKWMLVVSMIPQSMLIVMAYSTSVPLDVIIVIFTSLTTTTLFALNVPVIVHVLGHEANIGVYVGVFNAANCLGQLINFIVGASVVGTSMGYKLPVFLGGLMSLIGLLFTLFFFKVCTPCKYYKSNIKNHNSKTMQFYKLTGF